MEAKIGKWNLTTQTIKDTNPYTMEVTTFKAVEIWEFKKDGFTVYRVYNETFDWGTAQNIEKYMRASRYTTVKSWTKWDGKLPKKVMDKVNEMLELEAQQC